MERAHGTEISPEIETGIGQPGEVNQEHAISQQAMGAMHKSRGPTGEHVEGAHAKQGGHDNQNQTTDGGDRGGENDQCQGNQSDQGGDNPMGGFRVAPDHQHHNIAGVGPFGPQRQAITEAFDNTAEQDQDHGKADFAGLEAVDQAIQQSVTAEALPQACRHCQQQTSRDDPANQAHRRCHLPFYGVGKLPLPACPT
ncbi:hypothetical protein DLNHIDIE_03319 [Acidithiobacillus thiooxidans ATCC 19377]|uniref:Uncharacterized protein n=1 Tax=Acidithiobacillus thiooxidans ATCC 19377 TaxID=637390 RepID=A0A543PZG0_ACITH|nr:hypothetical protein DLNHIDIE_03319 [Acidithiobacillus thiooxidans ATCC 19377]